MSTLRGRPWAWSISLVVGGVVLLLFNLGYLDAYAPWPQFLLALGCAVAATVFFAGFARNRADWWRLLPAWTLTALATMALTSTIAGVNRALIAAQVFGGLALAFSHIYLQARAERWWAILPGGFMLVLALVVAANAWVTSTELLAGLLFVGLGLVFFLLYMLDQKRRQWWALIPGSVLLVFGALALSAGRVDDAGLLRWWPLVLVAAGLIVALRPVKTAPAPEDKFVVSSAPQLRSSAGAGAKQGNGKTGYGNTPGSVTAQPPENPAAKNKGKGKSSSSTAPAPPRGALGEYTQPAPGASVEILPDND
jgi:hypothetical protein